MIKICTFRREICCSSVPILVEIEQKSRRREPDCQEKVLKQEKNKKQPQINAAVLHRKDSIGKESQAQVSLKIVCFFFLSERGINNLGYYFYVCSG